MTVGVFLFFFLTNLVNGIVSESDDAQSQVSKGLVLFLSPRTRHGQEWTDEACPCQRYERLRC